MSVQPHLMLGTLHMLESMAPMPSKWLKRVPTQRPTRAEFSSCIFETQVHSHSEPQPPLQPPTPYTPNFDPSSNPQPSTLNPQPSTLNPQPATLNPQPSILNPEFTTLDPRPSTRNLEAGSMVFAGPRFASRTLHRPE